MGRVRGGLEVREEHENKDVTMLQIGSELSPDVAAFAERLRHFDDAAEAIKLSIVTRLRDDGLNHHDVRCRVKTPESTEEKISRVDQDGNLRYPGGPFKLDDLVGIRVILFVESDIDAVAIALTSQFICHDDEDKTAGNRKSGGIGYAGRHLTLEVPAENTPLGCEDCVGQRFEVQLRTVLQHAWAEFEHDIRFKGSHIDNAEISRAFTMASTLIELADQQFVNISEVLKRSETKLGSDVSQRLKSGSLQVLLDRTLPAYPHSRASQYLWLLDVLAAKGITTVSALEAWLAEIDQRTVAEIMGYRFMPGQVRVIDDLLLRQFGEEYIQATKNVGSDFNREAKLRFRLRRLQLIHPW